MAEIKDRLLSRVGKDLRHLELSPIYECSPFMVKCKLVHLLWKILWQYLTYMPDMKL